MDILEYADNLVLHLQRNKRSYKCYTTGDKDKIKVVYGLSDYDVINDTKYMNLNEVKHLFVDSCINEYNIMTNLIFKKGLYGVAKELSDEYNKTNNLNQNVNQDVKMIDDEIKI